MTDINLTTPEYKILEDDESLIITVAVPLAKPNSAAITLENDVLTFDSSPYLFKLKLPHSVSDDYSNVTYEDQISTYTVKLKKDFNRQMHSDDEEAADEFDEFRELMKTKDCESEPQEVTHIAKQYYGFANLFSEMFGSYYNEFSDVFDLPNPDKTDVKERTRLRLQHEKEKWNDDHYLADNMESEHLKPFLEYKPPWIKSPVKDDLANDEIEELQSIPKKCWMETGLNEETRKICEFQMIDVLFGYAYNVRTTEGDNTVESPWTVNKLSSTLSWFEVFNDLESAILSCYRRCLTYPLYRSWLLTKTIHRDVVEILKLGSKEATRHLLRIKNLFDENESRYLLNTLYINDLCHFAFTTADERLKELSEQLANVQIRKFQVNEDLPILEMAAYMVLEEENRSAEEGELQMKDIVDRINEIKLQTIARETDESSTSSESSSDSSDDSTSSSSEDSSESNEDSE